jgi:four helix bundle protein
MPPHRLDDLIAFQLSRQFKREVYRMLSVCPAGRDFRYVGQLRASASSVEANIAEGFYRLSPREFARFLLIARGSLGESEVRLADGVDRGYFTAADCAAAQVLTKRTGAAIMALRKSVLARLE